MNRRRLRGGGGEEALESSIDGHPVLLEKWGEFHRNRE